ncbi:hypothetical protein C3747_2g470 [Trypanosoma cruzi]|uniref:C-type lectin domain-containing protein n=2 Tax=Trypanosoma cruzi TaxID=5693 RepID=Q4DYJ9_TRYCC|nr:hypothetical protein, conserved [Trypanosoma cruzi]EAN97610.1 hypothetical protein, conserved [Trypanosoma cruzi]PWV21592.1 hypothetical protein C3747_2g470 [Trypanosoma cruzi]|eukprot:XP_819461.1 hypothetical protein [Trypanosoma cruzi strain CL Brener]
MLLTKLFFFTVLLLVHTCHTEGTLYAVRGGCTGDPAKWTTRIGSMAENEVIVAFLRAQGIAFAGIAGYVQNGKIYWEDGSPVRWMPPGSGPFSTADVGFLVVQSDGSWGSMLYDVFPDTLFVCTDGELIPSTTITTSTQAPTARPRPIPTEAPAETTASASEVLDALATALSKAGSFDIVPGTTNSVEVPVPKTVLFQQLAVLCENHNYFFGVAFVDKEDAVKVQGVSTLIRGSGSTLGFVVPLDLMESGAKHYMMRVVAVKKFGTFIYRKTSAMIIIHSIHEVLMKVKDTVEINEEDMMDGKDVIRPLRIIGPGTVAPHALEVAPLTFMGLSLTLINNRNVGKTCAPSALPVNFVFVNGKLELFLTKEYVARVKTASRSLCASIDGRHIVIAAVEGRRWTFTTANSQYAYGESIKVVASGASMVAVATNMYLAFLSRSARCSSLDDTFLSLELETSVISAKTSVSYTLQDNQQEVTLYLKALSTEKRVRYLCVQHKPTAKKVRVVSLGGSGVKVAVDPFALPSPGWISIFNGSIGSIALKNALLPAQSEEDLEHFNTIFRLIMQNSLFVRFVSLPRGAEWTRKLQRCRGGTAGTELEFGVNGGVLQINIPLFFLNSSGILCSGKEYLRVDYIIYEPSQWLQRFGDSDAAAVFAVIPSLPSSAIRVAVTNWDESAHYAIRLAVDGKCRVGFTANIWQASDATHAVSFPMTVHGDFTLCVGIYTDFGSTSMFVATDRRVSFIPYETGVKTWEKEHEMLSGTWSLCGASSVCGYVSSQPFFEVCRSQTVMREWPIIVTEKFYSLGSFIVKLREKDRSYPGALVNGRVFIKRDHFTCQSPKLLEMSWDGGVYSTSAVIDRGHSVVTLKPNVQLAGVILGFASWDTGCVADSIWQKVLVSTLASATATVSVLDLFSLLGGSEDDYFVVCILQDSSWGTVSHTYFHTVTSSEDNKSVRADAIATSNPSENEELIYLWQTGTVEWNVLGSFLPNVTMSLALVWDNSFCHASPAYISPMRYVSATKSRVHVDSSFIAAAPTPTSLLYSCYYVEGAPAMPLRIEQLRNRRITIQDLSLSSINYVPHFAIRYNTTQNTTIIFSDYLKPPITQLELFLESSPEEEDVAAGCSLTSPRHFLSLMVQLNEFGLRYVSIPPSVPAMLGSAGREVYLRACATASKSVSPHFVQVSAYLVVNSIGTVTELNPLSLDLFFVVANKTASLLSLDKCKDSVKRYVAEVTNRNSDEKGILLTAKGDNHFVLFIEPTLGVSGEDAAKQLRAVYKSILSGGRLPLRVGSADGLLFVLYSVEGVHLLNQSSYDGFPLVFLTAAGGVDQAPAQEMVTQTVKIFCVVILPGVVGFVVFSLQRTLPRLNRPRLGKDRKKKGNGASGSRSAKADRESCATVPNCQDDKSPSPRIPQSMDTDMQFITITAEKTTADPLYDSDSGEAPTSLGRTPPAVGNNTFCMYEGGSRDVGSERRGDGEG